MGPSKIPDISALFDWLIDVLFVLAFVPAMVMVLLFRLVDRLIDCIPCLKRGISFNKLLTEHVALISRKLFPRTLGTHMEF